MTIPAERSSSSSTNSSKTTFLPPNTPPSGNSATDLYHTEPASMPSLSKFPRFRLPIPQITIVLGVIITVLFLYYVKASDSHTPLFSGFSTTLNPDKSSTIASPQTVGNAQVAFNASDASTVGNAQLAFNASDASTVPTHLRECPHVILFSSARHGSTWFLDSVEKCEAQLKNNGTFGALNLYTEIWNKAQNGPVRYIRSREAIDYVKTKMSLKFFPTPFIVHKEEAFRIIEGVRDDNIPFVLLTRNLENAFKSLMIAKESGVWNSNSKGEASEKAMPNITVTEKRFNTFRHNMLKFYETVKTELNAHSIPLDVLKYEDIKVMPWIILPHSECYVRNCNFLTV